MRAKKGRLLAGRNNRLHNVAIGDAIPQLTQRMTLWDMELVLNPRIEINRLHLDRLGQGYASSRAKVSKTKTVVKELRGNVSISGMSPSTGTTWHGPMTGNE
jgi:hypothetical protein